MRFALALTISLFASAVQAGDPMVDFGSDDPVMNAAIAEARDSLPYFLDVAASADLSQGGFLVKQAVDVGGENYEHIWVMVESIQAETLDGYYANEPNGFDAQAGDPVTVAMDEISDWSFYDADGLMKGNYTTRVMLPELDAETAAQVEAMLSPCPVESC
ncbi:YegJ family protein [Neogemmobacter tilapiae]|uniref:DUF2314 domain-containing protein n=1 Tax=Neogemmobacter tilapiae TaxID=875041 RepID=A0A918TXV9_9RHOB|nr:DUF2314 domain-containing protein [Gemmobacter tilapiae]GHC66732.1 hypothetical protein GCM10007315_34530 [Gemmobacter tilapiae]